MTAKALGRRRNPGRYLNVASRLGAIYRCDHSCDAWLNLWPLPRGQHDNRELSLIQVLLVPHVSVGSDHALEAVRLRHLYELAILQLFPPEFSGAFWSKSTFTAEKQAHEYL